MTFVLNMEYLDTLFSREESQRVQLLGLKESNEEYADKLATAMSENMEIRRRYRYKLLRDFHVSRGPVDNEKELRYELQRNTRSFVNSVNDHLIFK